METEDGTLQNLGGSYGRREATARGCMVSTQRLLARGAEPGLTSVDDATVVVHGYGNTGSIAAQLFCEAGAKIVAVSVVSTFSQFRWMRYWRRRVS